MTAERPSEARGPRREAERTCIGCRRPAPRNALLRFTVADGVVVADPERRLPGRGAWLHDSEECRELAARRRAFERAFRQPRRD